MATLPEIKATGDKTWTNRHETFTQSIDNLYTIFNGDSGDLNNDYKATTSAIQNLIGQASSQGKTLRALGGCWSFSEIAATDGWLVNTMNLNMLFNISDLSISPNYTGERAQLLFVQCGNSVQELNRYLEGQQKALKTSGASNGQTIVGAISTGTHGAAFNFGATQDFVVGIHLIVSPTRHIWLERASYPVVSGTFLENIQTEIVRDDQLFNAALVGIGSMGFVHGLMIETEPIYLLEGYRQLLPLDHTLQNLLSTLDFTNSPLPNKDEVPFHFQVVVNQYDLAGGAYVTSMYKRPYHNNYTPPASTSDKAGPGDDAPVFIGKLTDLLPATIPILVNNLIKTELTVENWIGTTGQIFTNTDTYGKVLSTAMGIPISYVNEVNNLLLSLNNTSPFPGIFAYRYVRKSGATLAFTQYDTTCVVELDGVQSDLTRQFYNDVWNALDAHNIPYTFHWGKVHNLNETKVKEKYPSAYFTWMEARNKLLNPDMRAVFNCPSLIQLGLDKDV